MSKLRHIATMNMKKIVFLLLAVGSWLLAGAQETGDGYADRFNEHLNAGLQSSITMSVELPLYAYNTQVLTLQDTVTGGPAGYMYQGYFITDSAEVGSAVMTLQEGIRKFPNRLDLYFGLAATYLYTDQSDKMIGTVESAMQQEKKNKGNWLWTNDELTPDTIDYMYERVQEDFARFWAAEDLEHSERVAQMAVKYYPKRAEYWNNMGVVALWKEDFSEKPNFKKAMKYFKKALKLNPDDELIKANIEYIKGLKIED